MSTQTYKGSCHCGKLSYEANIDLEAGTARCNCTYCAKTRNWSAKIRPDAFKWLSGENEKGSYGFRENSQNHHLFCKSCGTTVCTIGNIPQTGGDYVNIRVAVLEGLTPERLSKLPITYMDGLHDNWFHPPEISHYL